MDKKRVRFNETVTIIVVPQEDRCGTWVQDAMRFRRRVNALNILLAPKLIRDISIESNSNHGEPQVSRLNYSLGVFRKTNT